jgi:hypothetical protein
MDLSLTTAFSPNPEIRYKEGSEENEASRLCADATAGLRSLLLLLSNQLQFPSPVVVQAGTSGRSRATKTFHEGLAPSEPEDEQCFSLRMM